VVEEEEWEMKWRLVPPTVLSIEAAQTVFPAASPHLVLMRRLGLTGAARLVVGPA